jgi:carbon monoxide dehydrogenase subunit G
VRVEDSIDIERPQEAVYALVRDLRRAPEWQESLEYVDIDKNVEVRRFAGRTQRAEFFVVDDDPPRRLVISSEGGPAKARAEFDFEPHGDGTRVKFALDVQLRGAARLAGGVVKPAAQREIAASLAKLKEVAES